MNKKKALGRGLSSFLSESGVDQNGKENFSSEGKDEPVVRFVPIETIKPNPVQPRKNFDSQELKNLSETIKEKGVLQPLIVVRDPQSNFMIVAGERRWRAAQLAQLHSLPVLVKDLSPEEILEIAIIENVQRTELGPLEEAEGFSKLALDYSYSHDKIAKMVGKSRAYITNTIRLLSLPNEVKKLLTCKSLSYGHARTLLNCPDPISLSRLIVKKGLSVRQTEFLAKKQKIDQEMVPLDRKINRKNDPNWIALERELTAELKLPVTISFNDKTSSGKVSISYSNLEELDMFCNILKANRSY